jgi:predicted aspartyl protease
MNGEPLLPIALNGKIHVALIDTGCNQSIIHSEVFEKLPKECYRLLEMPKKRTAAMANGEHIYFSHHILLKVSTCGIVYNLKTSVCSSISYDMVLYMVLFMSQIK